LLCLLIGIFGYSLLWVIPIGELSDNVAEPVRFRLDLNASSLEELVLLPGIGEVRAAAIVRYRQEIGPFRTVDELRRIKGIGPKTLAGLSEMVFVHPPEQPRPSPVVVAPASSARVEARIAAVPDRVD
jgi:competence protein ComEA